MLITKFKPPFLYKCTQICLQIVLLTLVLTAACAQSPSSSELPTTSQESVVSSSQQEKSNEIPIGNKNVFPNTDALPPDSVIPNTDFTIYVVRNNDYKNKADETVIPPPIALPIRDILMVPQNPGWDRKIGTPIKIGDDIHNGPEQGLYRVAPDPEEIKKARFRCGKAITALGDPRKLLDVPGFNKAVLLQHRDQIVEFDDACLSASEDDAPFDISAAKQLVGFLTYNGRPFCGATLIGKQHVLTARHCFRARETGVADCPYWVSRQNGMCDFEKIVPSLMFASLDNSTQRAIDSESVKLIPHSSFNHSNDFVVLRLKQAVNFNIAIQWVEPTSDMALWVPGPFPLRLIVDGLDPATDWINGVRWTRNMGNYCRVLAGENGECVFHTCETLGNYSGAPLVIGASSAKGNVTLNLVGIHLGFADTARQGDKVANCKLGLKNFGNNNIGLAAHVLQKEITQEQLTALPELGGRL